MALREPAWVRRLILGRLGTDWAPILAARVGTIARR
jgi:hypothetical protein